MFYVYCLQDERGHPTSMLILESGLTETAALALEQEYIGYLRYVGADLTNSDCAGTGHIQAGNTPANKGKPGKKHSEATKLLCSAASRKRVNFKHTEITKRRLSAAGMGKPAKNRIAVNRICPTFKSYDSLRAAAFDNNVHVSNVHHVCNGVLKSTGGVVFVYADPGRAVARS